MIYGIDLGNLKSRVAVTRRGGVDVILNEVSHRDSASYVSYTDIERFIGEKGYDQALRNANNTVYNLKRFLGVRADSPSLDYERTFVPFKIGEATDGSGELEFEVNYKGESNRFRPQQAVAALLGKLQSYVELDSISLGGPAVKGTDCVISCPVYYTMSQRKALLQAAQIAGINCMALLSEPTAAALDYGIFKSATFPDPEEGKLGHVSYFADIGHSATTISAVSFWKTHMKVLGCVYDTNLGTREIDNILLNYFRDEILKKYKIDVFENKKARFRLLAAIEKTKVVLSANPIANLAVECIMDDIDVSFTGIKRDDLEAMIQEKFLVPLEELCKRAVAMEGVPAGSPIEIIGGGSRMPAVKNIISKVFETTPSVTLVATETVAKGCAILAAMLSPKFKVRDYNIQDSSMWNVCLGYTTKDPAKPASVSFLPEVNKVIPLFKAGETFPKSLDLTFDRTEPFDLCYFYDEASEEIKRRLGASSLMLGRVTIGNIKAPELPTPVASVGALKVRVRFRMSLTGLVEIENAHIIQDYEVDEEVTKKVEKPVEGEKDKKETVEEKEVVRKRKEKRSDATLEPKVMLGMKAEGVVAAKKLEEGMVAQDRLVFETLEAKNALEGYMYDFTYKIAEGGELNPFVSPENVAAFAKLSSDVETWLGDEGWDTTKEEYQRRIAPLKEIGDKALARFRNAEDLPLATTKFTDGLAKIMARHAEIAAKKPEDSWHTEEDLASVKSKCEEATAWLKSAQEEYASKPKHNEPALTAALLSGRLADVERIVNPILNKPKPKPAPKPEEKKPEADEKKAEEKPAEKADAPKPDVDVD
eukprot:PhM_4_TR13338/c0_g1_i1/m.17554/K09489/HSPA4; heat shock 70kDa protein 4